MPVTFSCNHFENILMFDAVARSLLVLMGHSASVPGAIKAEDIPQALANLEAGIKQIETRNSFSSKHVDDDRDVEPEISLIQRAIPLIHMLKSAIKHHCDVM